MTITADPIPITGGGQDFYVPAFEVKVQGRRLESLVIHDVKQVSYRDQLGQLDNFEMSIHNEWDLANQRFRYSDGPLLDPGANVELWMGYRGRNGLRLMITGEVTSQSASFPASGPSVLSVTAQSVLHRMRGRQRTATYEKMRDSDIARQVGGQLGVTVHVDARARSQEVEHPYLFQRQCYDALFLLERAQRNGYELAARQDGDLFFGPSAGVVRPTYELVYGGSLISFEPRLSTANQVGSVKHQGWHPTEKRLISHEARWNDLEVKSLGPGSESVRRSFEQRAEVVPMVVDSEAEAQASSEGTMHRIAGEAMTGTGSVVGLPDLRSGGVVILKGLGQRYSGRYFVTSTTHTLGESGYTTQFVCRREERS